MGMVVTASCLCLVLPRRPEKASHSLLVGGEVSGTGLERGTLLKGDLGPWREKFKGEVSCSLLL